MATAQDISTGHRPVGDQYPGLLIPKSVCCCYVCSAARLGGESSGSLEGESSSSPETESRLLSNNAKTAKRTGVCKWFNVLKGWGFITPDDGGTEVFVHQRVLRMPGFRSLGAGEAVEFEAVQAAKGFEATIVTGPGGLDPRGSEIRPIGKKKHRRLRCYNCGMFATHTAARCKKETQPKSCYQCKSLDHLIADCPQRQRSSPSASASSPGSSELVTSSNSPSPAVTAQVTPEKATPATNANHCEASPVKSPRKGGVLEKAAEKGGASAKVVESKEEPVKAEKTT